MARWGMVVDLRRCIGCATCREVCDQSDERPPGVSRSVIEKEKGSDGLQERFFITMNCMHCDSPPCLDACPTGATYRRPDGIIEIRTDLCIGCGACIVACPYRARSICNEDVMPRTELLDGSSKEGLSADRIGTCTKCNFCSRIIDAGLKEGLKPGEDAEATPLCVRFCIADALYFGDLEDEDSIVSKLIRENKTARLLEEMDTGPNIFYISGVK